MSELLKLILCIGFIMLLLMLGLKGIDIVEQYLKRRKK